MKLWWVILPGSSLEMKRQIRSIVIRSNYVGWVRINIRPTIEDWMRHGQTSGTIEVVVTDARRQLAIDALQVFEPRNCSYTPSGEFIKPIYYYYEVRCACVLF